MNDDGAPKDPSTDPVLQMRVLREHVASVYASHTVAISAHFVWSMAIVLFGYPRVEPALQAWVLPWLALLTVVDACALLAPRWTPDVPLADTPRWARRFTVLVTLVSLTNVPAIVLLMVVNDPVVTSVATVVIMGSWTRVAQARWRIGRHILPAGDLVVQVDVNGL